MANRLTRSESNRIIAGVCGGLGAYLGIDPVIVRIAFLVLLFASGIGFPLYIVLAILMPNESQGDINLNTGKSVERNIEDLGENITKSFSQLEESGNGPLIIAGLLIVAGIYFLLGNLGITISLGFLAPVILIGVGVWLVARSNRS
jgi:phage shock protein C